MHRQAPRLDRRLVAALGKLDDPSLPIAETCRRAGELPEHLGLLRPSYQQIRVLVHAERQRAEARRAARELGWDIYLGIRSPRALFEREEHEAPERVEIAPPK